MSRIMTTRHITLSAQQGMVTELELMGQGFGPGERYMLRYHRTASSSSQVFDVTVPDDRSTWSGFRYRNNEVSILLLRQGRSSAAA
jgi:hypothetical protein